LVVVVAEEAAVEAEELMEELAASGNNQISI
jgi:hypothetical protein